MILPNPGGKVGHRRTHTQKRAPTTVPFFVLKNTDINRGNQDFGRMQIKIRADGMH
jgi:hypothetical protein